MRSPTRRNDPTPASIRAAPALAFRRRIKTSPATIEIAVEGHVRDLRYQRAAAHLHRLGPRPVLEALIEVANGHDLDRVLADFARLDPEVVRTLSGNSWPAAVVEVPGP